MILEEKIVRSKAGKNILIRSALPEDFVDFINYLKQTSKETSYLINEPEEITITIEDEERFILNKLNARKELLMVAYESQHRDEQIRGILRNYCE